MVVCIPIVNVRVDGLYGVNQLVQDHPWLCAFPYEVTCNMEHGNTLQFGTSSHSAHKFSNRER